MFAQGFFSGIKGNAQKPSKQRRNMPAKLKIAALMPTYYSASRPKMKQPRIAFCDNNKKEILAPHET